MKYLSLVLTIFLSFVIYLSSNALACDSCMCTLARVNHEGKLSETAKPLFFDFTFEQQVWHKRDVALAHTLHHQGHDSHDKTHEEFYHFGLGANLGDRFTILAEMPYVVRHAVEVDDHHYLGGRQHSEGFGDLNVTGIFKLLKQKNNFIGPLAGVKFPTGKTTERNKQGEKFEPEMQPGSGSFDPIMGGTFQYAFGRLQFHGNAVYTIRTKGAQEFRFGDLFSTYLYADYELNPKNKYFNTRVGIDTNIQHEQKQRSREGRVKDSGGTTWLLGPEISVRGNQYVSIFGNVLFPILQDLGGVHQHLRFIWNTGVKILF